MDAAGFGCATGEVRSPSTGAVSVSSLIRARAKCLLDREDSAASTARYSSKARLRSWDEKWLQVACSGQSDLLTEHILHNGDPTRICGAAPIHHMVTVLAGAKGRLLDYDQCPADEDSGSLVSIAGALF